MTHLPVLHKARLNKTMTYFAHADELTELLGNCRCNGDLALAFRDDPSQQKSSYDRFVKQENRLIVLTAAFTPASEDTPADPLSARYTVTVYAIQRSIRDDLIAKFRDVHFATLQSWLNEKQDRLWQEKPHTLSFLIDIETEDVEIAHDLNIDDYAVHGKADGVPVRRLTARRH